MELKDTAVYYLEDVEGISALSFVENPATHIEWFKFNDESVSLDFQKDEMERMVTGPIMVAETPMWKPQLNGYAKFSADQIKMMAKRTMIKKDFSFNEDHNSDKPIKGVHMIESFLISDKTQSKLYGNLPEGTWMGTFFIEDEDYWNNVIMTDKFKGFSLEGNFKPMLDEKIIEERFADISMVLSSDLDDDTKYDSIKSLLMDFACPPKGDGKRKDGEPDKRCGDPSKAKGGGGAKAKKENVSKTKEITSDISKNGFAEINKDDYNDLVKLNQERHSKVITEKNGYSGGGEDKIKNYVIERNADDYHPNPFQGGRDRIVPKERGTVLYSNNTESYQQGELRSNTYRVPLVRFEEKGDKVIIRRLSDDVVTNNNIEKWLSSLN
jgi:hypothetical protein